jgi:Cu2+-exporting ATPase
MRTSTASDKRVFLHVGGSNRATEKAVIESVLGRRPGVLLVEANPVAQTATITYDPQRTSIAELRRWVEECGLHCAGQSVPSHVCDPMIEPGDAGPRASSESTTAHAGHADISTAPAESVASPTRRWVTEETPACRWTT